MIKKIYTRHNSIYILILVLAILLLNVDFFVTKEFKIETIILFGLTIVLGLNLFRLVNRKANSLTLLYISNGLTLLAALYGFLILVLLFFVYEYKGKDIPVIWIIGLIINLLLLVSAVVDVRYKYNHK